MIEEYFCISKEKFQCFWITKDNVAEFVDKYLYLDEHTITITEQFAYVKYVNYKYFTMCIKLNSFMVREQGDWTSYTKKEFDEMYEIIMVKPINHAFIVRAEKEQEFLSMKADPEMFRKHRERAEIFKKK